jgi:hypothetical protein
MGADLIMVGAGLLEVLVLILLVVLVLLVLKVLVLLLLEVSSCCCRMCWSY